jgi:hypothetical protein
MPRRILSMFCPALGASLCAFALSASSAAANWAHEECGDGAHCYAVSTWRPGESADILNTWSYIDTEAMDVPEPGGNFISNEQWTSWKKPRYVWIEAGQVLGQVGRWDGPPEPEQLRAFYGFFHETKNGVEGEDLNGPPVPFDSRNLYQFYSDVPGDNEKAPGEDWCIKWGGPIYPASQEDTVICEEGLYHYGPATHLETGVEAATEREPANSGSAEGFAEGGREDRWQEVENERNHAKLSTKAIKVEGKKVGVATCAEKFSPHGDYGSLRFGAGQSCAQPPEEGDKAAEKPSESDDAEEVTESLVPRGGPLDAAAGLVPSDNDPFAGVMHPVGAKAIPLSAVAQIAAERAAQDGGAPPHSMTVSQATLGQALEAIRPNSVRQAREHANAAQTAYLSTPTDLVELHGSFTLKDIPVPRGAPTPTGTVLRLLVNADTGEVEGRWVGSAPTSPIRGPGPLHQIG